MNAEQIVNNIRFLELQMVKAGMKFHDGTPSVRVGISSHHTWKYCVEVYADDIGGDRIDMQSFQSDTIDGAMHCASDFIGGLE